MKLQGNVKGHIYVVTQQAYDGPIDGTRPCKRCGAEFCRYTSRQTRCKACQKVHMREYKRAYNRRYWNDNGEIYRAAARARRAREKGETK